MFEQIASAHEGLEMRMLWLSENLANFKIHKFGEISEFFAYLNTRSYETPCKKQQVLVLPKRLILQEKNLDLTFILLLIWRSNVIYQVLSEG